MSSGREFGLSVVVPFYNEAECAADAVLEIARALGGWPGGLEIVAVNDGSADGTLEALESLRGKVAGLEICDVRPHSGQSAALYWGIRRARGRLIATIDGDMQNEPADLPALAAALDRADLVVGWRVTRRDAWLRRVSSLAANSLRRFVLRDGVHDTGCGLKVFRRDAREALVPFQGMHRFIPALFRAHGLRVAEVPVRHRPRIRGRSKYGVGNRLFRGLLDLWGVWWLSRRAVAGRPQGEDAA